ncbi:MAG TPA: HAD family hydrolase [Myxococcota bacterium]|nr:HAD family hydrolase [Myxococcota bacterium]
MPVRAVLFDLFDTLVDIHMERLPLVEIGGRRVPSTYGLLHDASVHWHGLDFDAFAAALGKIDREQREFPTIERFRALGEALGLRNEELAQRLTRVHMAEVARHVTFQPHHPEVLARLRGRARLAVCSNFSHSDTAREVLASAGLLEHFDAVVISMDVGLRKPRAEIFRAALAALGAAPEETLHVGDSLEADVGGAAPLGIRPVWITRRVADREGALRAFAGPAPAHTVTDLAELEPLVLR